MKGILFLGTIAVLPVAAQTTPENNRADLDRALANLTAQVQDMQVRVAGGVVKNAPYSAEATTTTTQTLADGNRIEQSTTQKLYRDSEGRERREESVMAVGALAQPDAPVTITISDPVEKVSYTLNPQAHTARRTPGTGMTLSYVAGNNTLTLNLGFFRTAGGTRLTTADTTRAKEDLGSQVIEGVTAQGTRTTETIPAGMIGNLLPIDVVDEVWYSADLHMNVETTHNDPRTGEMVYKLTNINRGEQPMSLFEPPADYTITGPPSGGRGGRGPAPANQQ